jgi:hypothetical protein
VILVGEPLAEPVLREDAGGREYFFFRFSEQKSEMPVPSIFPVYAYIHRNAAQLLAPGHRSEVRGGYEYFQNEDGSPPRRIFRATEIVPRERR